jgi:hypothetical protein
MDRQVRSRGGGHTRGAQCGWHRFPSQARVPHPLPAGAHGATRQGKLYPRPHLRNQPHVVGHQHYPSGEVVDGVRKGVNGFCTR